MDPLVMFDAMTLSNKTQKVSGWAPSGPSAFEDIPVVVDFMRLQRANRNRLSYPRAKW